MFNSDFLGMLILFLVLVWQILYRRKIWFFRGSDKRVLNLRFSGMIKYVWVISILLILGVQTYWSVGQYKIWKDSPFSQFLLPPHQPINYFLGYVGIRLFAPWALAFLASLLFSWAAAYFNKKYGERFFEKEEIEFIALGTFLTGYPGFLFYLAVILVLGTLISVFYQVFSKGRLPLYYFWMPFAIFAIIIKIKFLYILGIADFWGQFSLGDFFKLFTNY